MAELEAASSWVAEVEIDCFDGDFTGSLSFGDSKMTFVGLALTLNERSGESATLVGDRGTGVRLTGDRTGSAFFAGNKLALGSFCGDSSPGQREMRLLRRRVDRLLICFSSIFKATSSASAEAGTSNLIRGCRSATMDVEIVSFVGWIGQRELWRFLGTHFSFSSGNVEGLPLAVSVVPAAAAASFCSSETEPVEPTLGPGKQKRLTKPVPRASTRSWRPSCSALARGSHRASPQTGM